MGRQLCQHNVRSRPHVNATAPAEPRANIWQQQRLRHAARALARCPPAAGFPDEQESTRNGRVSQGCRDAPLCPCSGALATPAAPPQSARQRRLPVAASWRLRRPLPGRCPPQSAAQPTPQMLHQAPDGWLRACVKTATGGLAHWGMSHCTDLVAGAALHEGGARQRRARALHGRQEPPDGVIQWHDLHQPHKLLRLVVHQGHAHQRVLVALVHAATQHVCSSWRRTLCPALAVPSAVLAGQHEWTVANGDKFRAGQ